MDYQNRVGSKPGAGGPANAAEAQSDRKERLRRLALETIDLDKDPFFMKNHLGSYECKLCLTLHINEGSYLAHTQGKKHQANLARRSAKEAARAGGGNVIIPTTSFSVKNTVKIGRPGYQITKVRDPITLEFGLLFQLLFPELSRDVCPKYRFMSAFEQKVEQPNKAYQYILFAAEPYETIGFRLQSREVDRADGRFWTYWDRDSKQYSLQFFFK